MSISIDYHIVELNKDLIIKHYKSFITTFNYLTKSSLSKIDDILNVFENIYKQWSHILVAINEEHWIIGMWTLMLQQTFARNWALAWHIEYVSVDQNFKWIWIWTKILSALCDLAKQKLCYKIILDCEQDLIWFYQKHWFEVHGVFMRKYL